MSAGYGAVRHSGGQIQPGGDLRCDGDGRFQRLDRISRDLDLPSETTSSIIPPGVAFDNMSLQIDVNGVAKATKTFASLTGSAGARNLRRAAHPDHRVRHNRQGKPGRDRVFPRLQLQHIGRSQRTVSASPTSSSRPAAQRDRSRAVDLGAALANGLLGLAGLGLRRLTAGAGGPLLSHPEAPRMRAQQLAKRQL